MDVTKTSKLNELYEKWVTEFPAYRGKFSKDGVINDDRYERSQVKILFMAKEPNDPKQTGFDFRDWWSKSVDYAFSNRICEWAYGILNRFPPLHDLDQAGQSRRVDIMQEIAFANIKKIGGGGSSDPNEIRKTLEREQHLLKEQIAIINPQVIVGGLGQTELWQVLFPALKLVDSGFDIKVGRHDNHKVIDYYHPLYQVPRAMSYCLLGQVYLSKVFQTL